ncbi:late expression factor 11 [Condylorrhiza vestigialis mutiple nucleopolyhedrovirus]|uniref:Late expression factor 11 n=1 Tax=Condylorrhiza vestigialis mutiple nucleopolyhedrovirus TaxID=1592576 RepID=A0A0B4UM83_9ABAC|nr:late expression factor 11 [Condylorrhiza vestigialis mutiple nucleopolyhedrovirus]AJD09283.1 late expression factor 11 [Condylorrhiza vestigialis mutiple nucleopolyhedrovirus]
MHPSNASSITTLTPCRRARDHNADCFTRSELYALWSETVNTLKRTFQIKNVHAHILEDNACNVKDYIRENLSRFTVITNKCSKRKVCHHHIRVARTLNLKKNLVDEYICSVTDVYHTPKWSTCQKPCATSHLPATTPC